MKSSVCKKKMFQIKGIDHVAINAINPMVSIEWYKKVLGFTAYKNEKWGAFPIFMEGDKCGVAIFQAKDTRSEISENHVRVDHFAFCVDDDNYKKAKAHFSLLSINYIEKDHYIMKSLYVRDPDENIVDIMKYS